MKGRREYLALFSQPMSNDTFYKFFGTAVISIFLVGNSLLKLTEDNV